MKTLQDLQKIINDINNTRYNLYDEIKTICQDKTLSLDDRWELFASSNLGEHSQWIEHFNNIDLEDFSRYGYINLIDIVDSRLDDLGFYDYEEISKECDFNLQQYSDELDKINKLREEILEKWIKSYTIDW
jgi:hypothetical protein